MNLLELNIEDSIYTVEFDSIDENIAPAVAAAHTWEPWQLKLYSYILAKDSICIDAGANVGVNAIAMAHYVSTGMIYAFEPVSRTETLLQNNVSRNNIKNVSIIRNALGNIKHDAVISVVRSSLGTASIGNKNPAALVSDDRADAEVYSEIISVITLDDWWRNAKSPRVDFLKIDVEGFEINLLVGGEKFLRAHPNLLAVCELNLTCHVRNSYSAGDVPFAAGLLGKLQSHFQYIYFMGRDFLFYEIANYAQLRLYMFGGHPVDDLFCCNKQPTSLQPVCSAQRKFIGSIVSETVVSNFYQITYLSRYTDGWAGVSPGIAGTQGGAIVSLSKNFMVELSVRQIWTKHAGAGPYYVCVAIDDSVEIIDVSDIEYKAQLNLTAGVHYISVESFFSLKASVYLGNPGDSRTVGAGFLLSFQT